VYVLVVGDVETNIKQSNTPNKARSEAQLSETSRRKSIP